MIINARYALRAVISMAALFFPLWALAEKDAAREDAPARYLGRTIAPVMGHGGAPWLLRASRAKEEATDEMLDALKLEAGQVVCDFGCGNGYHTLRFASMVGPAGKVHGADLQEKMLAELKTRASEAGITNVETILCQEADANLPAKTFDMVFLCDVYHELSDPVSVLRQVKQSLKPKGLLVLVEFREEDASVPIKPLHKMSKAQIKKEMSANGFTLERSYDKLPWQHLLFFKKSNPGG